jgi:glyoxylase-like metal-dependent hydrolase (beta-lactamase superfamily II)
MIPLEDNFADIIGKAQSGLQLSDTALAEQAGVDAQTLRKLRAGEFDEPALLRIAPALGLNGDALCELARGAWQPEEIEPIDGFAAFTTPYHDMTVNSYVVWDPETKAGAAFDTGADCAEMLRVAGKHKLKIELILLTHAHPDHIADLPRLREETGAHIYISEREAIPGAESIEEGKAFCLGKIDIDTRLTWGHSRGGMTYVITGLARKLAIVGDSLFAGSMGGGSVSYEEALRNNLERILTLPDETVICPGHGPMTTVGEEKSHNPFFAGQL